MTYVNRVLFFATPVDLPGGAVARRRQARSSAWQPLFPLFACYQAIFGGQDAEPRCCSSRRALWAIALLVIGGRFFLRREREIHR